MPCKRDCAPIPPRFQFCSTICTPKCSHHCFQMPSVPIVISPRPWLPPPPPPPQLVPHPPGKTLLLISLITTATLLGTIFMLCLLIKKFRECRRRRRRHHRHSTRNGPVLFDVHGLNLPPDDDEEGPVLDHHVWYINTVGLQQSVIDSITMFKYRKDEKFIDGSDCSICLGEFQDDESLRLLPKCSHAFHVPCIDTWLRSHKNCPLCRAPVVSNSVVPNLTAIEPIANQPPPIEDAQVETEAVEEENREDDENSGGNCEVPIKGLSRTLSDLTENQNQVIPMRRSVSMDSVSAMAIYQATANLQIPEEGCSSSSSSSGVLVGVKNSVSNSRNLPFPKRGVIGNQSLYNLVKSISIGRSVAKGAISMKRLSSGRKKLEWGRHYRSQSSVLPL